MEIDKATFLAAEVPEVAPVYSYTVEIDTTPTGTNRTWAELCAGINNLSEALNETIQQYFFLCGHGFAANYVTGMAPSVTLTGVRAVGDTAQDYIFGLKYSLMGDRNTNLRITRTDEDASTEVISAHVTIGALSEIGGATTDGSAISIELRFTGEPYVGDAWSDIYGVTQNLTHCTSSYASQHAYGGLPFTAYLTAEDTYTLGTPTVTMGGTSVSDAWNADQGSITIANVTGAIVITATASK